MHTTLRLQRSWINTMTMIALSNMGFSYATGPTFSFPMKPTYQHSPFNEPIAATDSATYDTAPNPYMQDEYNNNAPYPYPVQAPSPEIYVPSAHTSRVGIGSGQDWEHHSVPVGHRGEHPGGHHGEHPGGHRGEHPGGHHGEHPGGHHGEHPGGHHGEHPGGHHGEHPGGHHGEHPGGHRHR